MLHEMICAHKEQVLAAYEHFINSLSQIQQNFAPESLTFGVPVANSQQLLLADSLAPMMTWMQVRSSSTRTLE